MSRKNISRLIATDVINELYDVVSLRPEIMVNNWLASAYLTICREIASEYSEDCGCLEEYMEDGYMSDFVKEFIKINPNWKQLHDWYFYHHNRSLIDKYTAEYEIYSAQTRLELAHYSLSM